jgi:hypothetical protein
MCGSGTVFPDGGDSILHGADVFIVETDSKGGKDVLPDMDRYAAAGAGNRRIDKDKEVKYNKRECFTGVEYYLYM